MQYTRFLSPAFVFAVILSAASNTAAQRPGRDPVAPPRDTTVRATPADAPSSATPLAAGQCQLTYERADNMWAAPGRPDGNLGEETIRLEAGQRKVFSTDWRYEKMRNDGVNYYGSHARIITNNGSTNVSVITPTGTRTFGPFWAVRNSVKLDIQEVVCPVR